MKDSINTGISFGLTSGVITTLGLMVGLHSGTHSKLAVMGGILTIAIADAFSDALGIHISEECENVHTHKQIWAATISTFLTKLLFAMTFMVPVMLFPLSRAVIVSVVWGMTVIALFSYRMALVQKQKPVAIVGEHLLIAVLVVLTTHYVGDWVARVFAA